MTEETLTKAFGQYGDVYSVKVMWPEAKMREEEAGTGAS